MQNLRVHKISLFALGVLVFCLMTIPGLAETYKLTTGETLTGELLAPSATDAGVKIKVGDGKYEQVSWDKFSQEDLKKMKEIKKLEPFVEPYIEITQEERIKKTEVDIKQPQRFVRPPHQSLLGAMFSSGLGVLVLLLLYAANVYAGYEVAIFRAQSVPMVCGVSAVLPLIGPIIFLSMKTNLPPREAGWETGSTDQGPQPTGAPSSTDPAAEAVNPMLAAGAEHPTGLKLAHEPEAKADIPATQTFQRGQFTFNRRFIETKFSGFFGVVRREADKDMVMFVKSARGEYVAQRVTRIAANDMHIQVQKGPASEEVMIPFQDIKEIQLKHKDAP